MKRLGMLFSALLLIVPCLYAQEPIGIFDDHVDVGEPGIPGWVQYDSASGQYLVDAVGATIGNRSYTDEFHFAYKKVSGSFAIEANPYPLDDMGRGGLMIRQDLDPDSPHISLLMTSGPASDSNSDLGSVFPTFRTLKGGGSVRDGDPDAAPGGFTDANSGPIRLERIGNSVHMYRMTTAGEWVWFQSESCEYTEEVLAGLAATAENTNNIGYFEFNDVVIEELPLNVMRDLPTDTLTKGASLTGIKLTAKARSQVAIATIQELMPLGAKATNVKASAGEATLNANGSITWILTDFTGEATLTYDTVLSQRDSAAWRGTFNDGVYRDSYIGGEALLPKAPQFAPPASPIDIDPIFPTIIQAEQGNWIQAETDFGLMLDLKTSGGISVVAMSGSAQAMMEYPIYVKQAGTYYIFGRVRSEDGNSDSFHFEVDDFPAGDGTSYWTVSIKKGYANEWVSADAPREDPRAFEWTAGEHYLYLASREDSASIDWLCITNNGKMAITSFTEETEYTVSRSISDTVFAPGKTYNITLARAASSSFNPEMSVTDTPPPEWTVSGLKASGGTFSTNDSGQIVWSLDGVAGSQTLTYTVTPPRNDLIGGKFEGVYFYQGQEIPLSGDNIIAQSFTFKNVNVANPVPVKLVNGEAKIEAEDAYLLNSSTTNSFSIRFDPDASEELYTYAEMSPSSITGDELDFVFEVATAGTYRAIARSRTPNGTDDSFYVGMDNDIQAIIPGYRFQGKNILDEAGNRLYDDLFHVSWVDADETPDLSWDLTAGVHRLRFHAREDGSQLDWVIITNNLDQNPDDLETPSTAVDLFMLY